MSAASAKQRRGRAGRVRPGTCYKMFSRRLASNLQASLHFAHTWLYHHQQALWEVEGKGVFLRVRVVCCALLYVTCQDEPAVFVDI